LLGTGQRREFAYSFFLLALALAFIWICRTHSPNPIRHFFAQAPFETPLDFLLLFAAVLSAMLLHEFGHLLASLLLGFEILGGTIGPLQIQMLAEDAKVSWSWKKLFSASISAVPRNRCQLSMPGGAARRGRCASRAAGPRHRRAGSSSIEPLEGTPASIATA